jgi:cell wall-associated NlpC family hydrolase
VGTPYQYGGDHPSEGFDCSGLVFFTHRQLNLSIPRTSKDQYRVARRVTLHQAQPGDLVFFTDRRKLSHVGIYLGDQRFVHAPSSGRRVSVARLDEPYYREHLVGLGRLH